MISVIICSRSASYFAAITTSIKETIGVCFEIIKIENADLHTGICKAYNKGALQAKFPILVFVHEDVLFRTNNWGSKLKSHFNEVSNAGVIGVAGGVYKTKMVSGWWQSEVGWKEPRRMNIVQHNNNGTSSRHVLLNPNNQFHTRVVSLDGVFMAVKKEVWEQHKFDESLKGFHGYDFDFCMQVGQQFKNIVVFDILMDHFSGGRYDINWMQGMIDVHKKWNHALPVEYEKCTLTDNAVYTDGWKRLRKHLGLAIAEKISLSRLVNFYHAYFFSLDKRPGFFNFYIDYIKGFIWLFRMYWAKKNISASKPSFAN